MWTIWIPLILQCFGDKFDGNKRMIWRNCFNVSNGIWLIGYYSPSERLWSSIWPFTYGSGSQSSVSLLIVSAVLPLKVHKTPNPHKLIRFLTMCFALNDIYSCNFHISLRRNTPHFIWLIISDSVSQKDTFLPDLCVSAYVMYAQTEPYKLTP